MSDVEVIDRADIVRREVDRESNERALAVMDPAILDTMFASRDPKAIVQRIAECAGGCLLLQPRSLWRPEEGDASGLVARLYLPLAAGAGALVPTH